MKKLTAVWPRVTAITAAAVWTALVTVCLLGAAAAPRSAAAATVSGVLENGADFRVVLLQADGKGKKVAPDASGAFTIAGVKLKNASLHIVYPDGMYYGPVVLKAKATKAYATIKGTQTLSLGAIVLRDGYAKVGRIAASRVQVLAAYTARARNGVPVGVAKLGRVRTPNPMGMRGDGGDLDLDGVAGAFDIDDNGNLILDNFDRTGRGFRRPPAGGWGGFGASRAVAGARGEDGGPPPLRQPDQLTMVSQFWVNGVPGPWPVFTVTPVLNANIPGIQDLEALINHYLPGSLFMGTEVPVDGPATIDGLGNSYLRAHTVADPAYAGATFPIVDESPGTFDASGALQVWVSNGEIRPVAPGTGIGEVAAGDCYVVTASNGVQYPAILNYAFYTTPALKSYRFDTDAETTEVAYDAGGVPPQGHILVPRGATTVTLTFWRPQRKASPGEAASAGGWIDIGGLWWGLDVLPPDGTTVDLTNAILEPMANGSPFPRSPYTGGLLDPTPDQPADPGHVITFTFSMAAAFPGWDSLPPESTFYIDLQASSGFGDNTAGVGGAFMTQ